MIKKFEEFVNESYYDKNKRNILWKQDVVKYLSTLGVNKKDCQEIYDIATAKNDEDVSYDTSEVENILKRIPVCNSVEGIVDFMKNVFFIKVNNVGITEDLFYDWLKEHGVKIEDCPVVIGYKNKLLTGDVVWCEYYGIYFKDEDDMVDSVYDNATNEFYVERELEEIYESDVEEINLDKECGWVDNGEWMK